MVGKLGPFGWYSFAIHHPVHVALTDNLKIIPTTTCRHKLPKQNWHATAVDDAYPIPDLGVGWSQTEQRSATFHTTRLEEPPIPDNTLNSLQEGDHSTWCLWRVLQQIGVQISNAVNMRQTL